MSAALHSQDMGRGRWVREGRRNAPSVKVKGLERGLGGAGENAPSLCVVLTLHMELIPQYSHSACAPPQALRIKPQNESLYLYPPEHTVPE